MQSISKNTLCTDFDIPAEIPSQDDPVHMTGNEPYVKHTCTEENRRKGHILLSALLLYQMILSGQKEKKPEVHILFLFSDQRCQRNGASVSVGRYVRTCIETVGCGAA